MSGARSPIRIKDSPERRLAQAFVAAGLPVAGSSLKRSRDVDEEALPSPEPDIVWMGPKEPSADASGRVRTCRPSLCVD